MCNNQLGCDGCLAIADHLRLPECSLRQIDLSSNPEIGDSCATILAAALVANRQLWKLCLAGYSIIASGLEVFSNLICDRWTMMSTFSSNHVLRDLGNVGPCPQLSDLLALNRDNDTQQCAAKKILHAYSPFHPSLFLNWNLNPSTPCNKQAFPVVVEWFTRVSGYTNNSDTMITTEHVARSELNTLYQLAKAIPSEFEFPPSKKGLKRKRQTRLPHREEA